MKEQIGFSFLFWRSEAASMGTNFSEANLESNQRNNFYLVILETIEIVSIISTIHALSPKVF